MVAAPRTSVGEGQLSVLPAVLDCTAPAQPEEDLVDGSVGPQSGRIRSFDAVRRACAAEQVSQLVAVESMRPRVGVFVEQPDYGLFNL